METGSKVFTLKLLPGALRCPAKLCEANPSAPDTYVLVRAGRKTSVLEIDKSDLCETGENTTALGQLAKHYLGELVVACKKAHTPVTATVPAL